MTTDLTGIAAEAQVAVEAHRRTGRGYEKASKHLMALEQATTLSWTILNQQVKVTDDCTWVVNFTDTDGNERKVFLRDLVHNIEDQVAIIDEVVKQKAQRTLK